jgi:uncharacterized repeat protein (TIGR01451 family)
LRFRPGCGGGPHFVEFLHIQNLNQVSAFSFRFYPVLVLLLAVGHDGAFAQSPDAANPWQPAGPSQAARPASEYWVVPQVFRAVALDHAAMKIHLARAPHELSRPTQAQKTEITLPMPDGTNQRFLIVEAPVMEPELAAKFPEIKTYVGQGIDDPAASVRLDLTPAGFHAQILSPRGAVYIDPHLRDRSVYASYYKRDYRRLAEDFQCLTPSGDTAGMPAAAPAHLALSGANLRTYRLACAADGEYTAFQGGTVAAGMAAVVTAVNRVTGVYESELAIRLVLVANNDLLIYTNANTDPYSNTSGSTMLNQNQSTIDSVIGSANYDIGHVFSTGGGGIAGLGVVCIAGQKARGVTGNSSPTGDSFWIDYVAHEMGHQFGGNHTFNSSTSNCGGGNRNASTAYEQGSGSTIMAYAGICGSDDLQPHSDPYFHAASFDEIIAYTTTGTGSGCPTLTATGNSAPVVSAGPNYTIPQNTPFTLTATGSDPDGDPLTYCWEERDLGPSTTVTTPDNGSSPLFRSFSPTTSPSRTFPRLQDLLNNTLTIGEVMPTTTRTMNFRVTARDNRAGGGGVNSSDMQVSVVSGAGPFVVTSHNSGGVFSNVTTVTWNVAGTTAAPINATNVNILLSTNGGLTFPITLASSAPNNGSHTVPLPSLTTTNARIMVAAAGNIFFDLGSSNFSIVPGLAVPAVTLDSTALAAEGCSSPNNAIDPDETVTVNFALKNTGSSPTTNLVATLVATNGITLPSAPQSFGVLAPCGPAVSRPFTFTASGTCGGTITAQLRFQDGAADLGAASQVFNLGALVVRDAAQTNAASIAIPGSGTKGPASPFPSSIAMAGVTGTVTKVTVTLTGFAHTNPQDVDVLLVGPTGQTVLLLSDAGGTALVSGLTFTFDDDAPTAMTQNGTPTSGTYKPTNYGTTSDTFSSPAPGGTYGSTLSAFNGLDPNGTWSLYVQDDASQHTGSIAQGWSIHFTTLVPDCCSGSVPLADVGIDGSASPAQVNVGSNVVLTLNVTNLGPDSATGVVVTDTLPPGLNFVSASSTQGTPTNNAGTVTCLLGTMTNLAHATISIQATATAGGAKTNSTAVSSATTDPSGGNNAAANVVFVNTPPTISPLASVITNEDCVLGPIPVNIGDAETPAASLALTAACSNTNLIPPANILLGGSGSTRTVTFTPATNQSGAATITLTVSDGQAATSTAFDVTINPMNDAPVLAAIPDFTLVEGSTLTVTNSATDVDLPPQQLAFSLAAGPTNATINPASGVLVWTSTEYDGPGTNHFSVVVTDNGSPSLSATQQFTVVVLESNLPPVLAAVTDRTVHAGTLIQFTNSATDPDWPANALTFSLAAGAPSGAIINSTNGLFTWLTGEGDVNTTNRIGVRVTDDGLPPLSNTNVFQVVVVPKPVIAGIVLTNGVAMLTWTAIAGQSYRIQTSLDLEFPNWTNVGTDVTASSASAELSITTETSTQQFYRVRVVP